MKLLIEIPEAEYNECVTQVELMKQEGILIESLNTALRIFVANGIPQEGEIPQKYGKDDLIHRETAKRIIDSPRNKEQMLMMLASIPKVETETAEWKIENNGGTTMWYECSKCGEAGDIWDKFCKHCGRKITNAVAE